MHNANHVALACSCARLQDRCLRKPLSSWSRRLSLVVWTTVSCDNVKSYILRLQRHLVRAVVHCIVFHCILRQQRHLVRAVVHCIVFHCILRQQRHLVRAVVHCIVFHCILRQQRHLVRAVVQSIQNAATRLLSSSSTRAS